MRHGPRPTWLPALLVLSVGLVVRPAPAEEEGPSPAEVGRALERGADWLRQTYAGGFPEEKWHDPVELVVLTLHHAGVNLTDPVFRAAMTRLEEDPLRYTYRTSVLAMALGEINPRLHLRRLAHAAQWLVDTQLEGGEWGYPGTVGGRGSQPMPVEVPPPTFPETEDGRPPETVEIERREAPVTGGPPHGDFSNTQFAILGLRACRDAGVRIPKATWEAALGYLEQTQREDGGWGYQLGGQPDEASYASLTAAGLCSTAICLHALGKRPAASRTVKRARAWLDRFLDVRRNVGIDRSAVLGPSSWQYYHLYSLERVGAVLDLEEIGDRPWYPAGARWILAAQRADGSWVDPGGDEFGSRQRYLDTADTCFAMLFLARRTPPLTR